MSELNEFRFCKERLQQLCPSLPKDIIEELSLGWRIVHFDKREHLITAGRIQADAFMIVQGLVRRSVHFHDVAKYSARRRKRL